MICIVRCHKRIMVRLPDGIVKGVGEKVACPSSCMYNGVGGCARVTEFEVKSSNSFDVESAIPRYNPAPIGYSSDEISTLWNERVSSASRVAEVRENQASQAHMPLMERPTLLVQTPTQEVSATQASGDTTIDSVVTTDNVVSTSEVRGSRVRSFGTPRQASATERAPAPSHFLKSVRDYDSFEIGIDIFSNDISLRRSLNARPLIRALNEIFFFWEIDLVFKSRTELNDKFIWLMTSVLDFDIPRADVQAIIENPNYDMSQKFFYLFYDVVFKRDPPRGFYWSNTKSVSQPLFAFFTDRRDFIVRYCKDGEQGERFRRFFKERKKEILHYLGVMDETAFFDEITFELAEENGEIVWIDRYNDYRPIRLGTLDDFIDSMQVPTSLSKMRAMIAFLQKYRVSSMGIVLRNSQHEFQRSERGSLQEDQSMYSLLQLGSSSSATEYDYYVTLLREYVRAFSPNQVTVGSLIFTKTNYSGELTNIVFEFCATHFGRIDDEYAQKAKARAWLAKSLYERGILCNFFCENDRYIRQLMDLIVNPTLEKYFSLFNSPLFRESATMAYNISEYIADVMDEDVFTVNGIFESDAVISEYFKVKIQDSSKLNMNNIYKEYQKQYDAFIKQ